MKKTGLGISSIAAALLLTAVSGCVVPPEYRARAAAAENFRTVALHLDKYGSVYTIGSAAELKETFSDFAEACEEAVWQSKLPEEKKLQFSKNLLKAGLLAKLTRLDEVTGWGASSFLQPDGAPFRMRNRLFFALPEPEKGLIGEVLAPENLPFHDAIAALPAQTTCAFALYLRPEALLEALKRSGQFGEDFAAGHLAGPVPWVEVMQNTEGWWSLALSVPDQARNLAAWRFQLTLPDKEKKVFQMLSRVAAGIPRSVRTETRLELPVVPGRVVIKPGEGKLICYFGIGAESFFEAPGAKKLGDLPEFTALLATVFPKRGMAWFCASGSSPLPAELTDCLFSGMRIPVKEEGICAGVLCRESDGWLWCCNGQYSWNELHCRNFIRALGAVLPNPGAKKKIVRRPAVKKSVPSAPAADPALCLPQLTKLLDACKKYASAHEGRFPETWQVLIDARLVTQAELLRPGVPASAVLSKENCRYFLFRLPAGAEKHFYPLIVEHPALHADGFHVIYSNGKIEFQKLARCTTLLRSISTLYTRHHWDESLFRSLTEQAAEFDKQGE